MRMRGVTVLVLATVLVLGGCRVKKERVGGRTRVDIQGETVQVTTETKTLKVGSESARVPVPQVHIAGDSARARDTTRHPAVPPPR